MIEAGSQLHKHQRRLQNAHRKTFASDLPMLQKKRTDLHPIATRFALPMPKLMI